jgi:nicotinamide phosphoribosyltransferase
MFVDTLLKNPLVDNCTDTDSYKPSHALLIPPTTTQIVSYLESRGGPFDTSIFMGLQYFKKEYLANPVTRSAILEANDFFLEHGEPFPLQDWLRVVDKHGGYLPIKIDAVPEGTEVPVHNMLMRIENTDPEIPWMGGWAETQSVRMWYPITVATQSFYLKEMILKALIETADHPWEEIYYKVHDFGGRGVTCREQAGIGGMADLSSFKGSDNVPGVRFANHFYLCRMAGFSIPASEHSTIILWGPKQEDEDKAYQNLINKYLKAGKTVACVSDTTDYFRVLSDVWCGSLLPQIKASQGTLVIRPDSGKPVEILEKTFRMLEEKVGMTLNSKGYKVLPPYLRVIQGDGVNMATIKEILAMMIKNKGSISNITFGSGGALLQKMDRDTQKFAFKPCWATVDGHSFEVFKDPATDPGKRSKAGDLILTLKNGIYQTIDRRLTSEPDILVPSWDAGKDLVEYTLDEVRATSERRLRRDLLAA